MCEGYPTAQHTSQRLPSAAVSSESEPLQCLARVPVHNFGQTGLGTRKQDIRIMDFSRKAGYALNRLHPAALRDAVLSETSRIPRLAGRLFDHYRVEVHPKLTSAKKPAHGQNEVRFVYFARRLGRAFGSKPDTTDLAQHCPLPGAGLVKPKCGASQVT